MAFINEYTINVDIKNRMSNIVPTYKQGESASLKFKVFDNGLLFDLTNFTRAEITFKLPDGTRLLGNATYDSATGLISYTFTGAEMAEIGNVET